MVEACSCVSRVHAVLGRPLVKWEFAVSIMDF